MSSTGACEKPTPDDFTDIDSLRSELSQLKAKLRSQIASVKADLKPESTNQSSVSVSANPSVRYTERPVWALILITFCGVILAVLVLGAISALLSLWLAHYVFTKVSIISD